MKKIFLFVILALIALNVNAHRKNIVHKKILMTEITGVVTYYSLSNNGNSADIGATVSAVPIKFLNDSIIDFVSLIRSKYHNYTFTLKMSQKEGATEKILKECLGDDFVTEADLMSLEFNYFDKYSDKISKAKKYETVIDASGKYLLKIPIGEYYIIITSANEKYLNGMVYIDKIKIKKDGTNQCNYSFSDTYH